jgi:hypothetical protein
VIERITAASPRLKARIAGAFYLLTIVAGAFAFIAGPLTALGEAASYVEAAFYVAVAVLFYFMFRPVSSGLSLLAALIGVVGSLNLPPSHFHLLPEINFNFFGPYCVLIGYLILKSTFLPRMIGVVVAVAGLGYLTSVWPPLETHLSPFIALVGLLAEGSLTVWLLLVGVDDRQWRELTSTAPPSP